MLPFRTRINRMIGDAIEALGYERPRRRGQGYHRDPFEDQAAIRPDARVIVDGGAEPGRDGGALSHLVPGRDGLQLRADARVLREG